MIPKVKNKLLIKKPLTSSIKKPLKKKLTRFRIRIRSRHPTHSPLRTSLPLLPFRSVVRLGSTTVKPDDGRLVECNTISSIRNSANKLLMKQCFTNGQVVTAEWVKASTDVVTWAKHPCGKFRPCVSKSLNGSRGRGNKLHLTLENLQQFLTQHQNDLGNYIFEVYHDYTREYRLHVTKDGYFYACRKMLKNETPDDKRWFRNDSNSTWIMETNESFNKPVNWNTIIAECVKALVSVGLDVGACDVKVQGAKDNKGNTRQNPGFIVIEINSAPSFGDITLQKYLDVIPQILRTKKSTV